MAGHAWALILAVIGLALGMVVRLRAARSGSKGAPLHSAMLLIPCAVIIGTLPWVFQLGETVKIVASVTSMIVTVAAMVLLVIQRTGAERESLDRPTPAFTRSPRPGTSAFAASPLRRDRLRLSDARLMHVGEPDLMGVALSAGEVWPVTGSAASAKTGCEGSMSSPARGADQEQHAHQIERHVPAAEPLHRVTRRSAD